MPYLFVYLSLTGLMLAGGSIPSYAASYCYNITDVDQRQLCLNQAQQTVRSCYNLANTDQRDDCFEQTARSRNNKNACYLINDDEQHERCLSAFSSKW